MLKAQLPPQPQLSLAATGSEMKVLERFTSTPTGMPDVMTPRVRHRLMTAARCEGAPVCVARRASLCLTPAAPRSLAFVKYWDLKAGVICIIRESIGFSVFGDSEYSISDKTARVLLANNDRARALESPKYEDLLEAEEAKAMAERRR